MPVATPNALAEEEAKSEVRGLQQLARGLPRERKRRGAGDSRRGPGLEEEGAKRVPCKA